MQSSPTGLGQSDDGHDIAAIRRAFWAGAVRWRLHAQERMHERGINRSDVQKVIEEGKVIETYREARPFPAYLIFGYAQEHPLHALIGYDSSDAVAYVITIYKPDDRHFESDWITRRRPDHE